jgi:putative sterol carrier protein
MSLRRIVVTEKAAIDAQLAEVARLVPQKLPNLTAVVGLDLTGEGGGQWTLRFASGAMTWGEGLDPAAEATLKVSSKDWDALVRGQLNPVSAFMTGRLKVVGNMAVIMKLQPLFQ